MKKNKYGFWQKYGTAWRILIRCRSLYWSCYWTVKHPIQRIFGVNLYVHRLFPPSKKLKQTADNAWPWRVNCPPNWIAVITNLEKLWPRTQESDVKFWYKGYGRNPVSALLRLIRDVLIRF